MSLVSYRVQRPPYKTPGSLPEAQLGCILHLEMLRGLASLSPLQALEETAPFSLPAASSNTGNSGATGSPGQAENFPSAGNVQLGVEEGRARVLTLVRLRCSRPRPLSPGPSVWPSNHPINKYQKPAANTEPGSVWDTLLCQESPRTPGALGCKPCSGREGFS